AAEHRADLGTRRGLDHRRGRVGAQELGALDLEDAGDGVDDFHWRPPRALGFAGCSPRSERRRRRSRAASTIAQEARAGEAAGAWPPSFRNTIRSMPRARPWRAMELREDRVVNYPTGRRAESGEEDGMTRRSGPFWDAAEGRAPLPRAAATLGLQLVDADVERETIELAFAATEAFTNPTGNVLGAFLAAMLYDTVGPALLATLEPDQFQSTVQLSVTFLRPVRPGRVIGQGRVVHRDEDLVFLEAALLDAGGAVVAAATATARVISLNRAPAAA